MSCSFCSSALTSNCWQHKVCLLLWMLLNMVSINVMSLVKPSHSQYVRPVSFLSAWSSPLQFSKTHRLRRKINWSIKPWFGFRPVLFSLLFSVSPKPLYYLKMSLAFWPSETINLPIWINSKERALSATEGDSLPVDCLYFLQSSRSRWTHRICAVKNKWREVEWSAFSPGSKTIR